jgi:hypothetical protein
MISCIPQEFPDVHDRDVLFCSDPLDYLSIFFGRLEQPV